MRQLHDLPAAAQALQAQARIHETPLMSQSGEIKWRIWGAGKPLLLIHGGAGSWLHWLKNIAYFTERGWQVIVPDLPGFGDSSELPSNHQLSDAARPVYHGLTELIGSQSLPIVGFSFGGVMSGAILHENPAQFSRLVLVGSGGLGAIRPTLEPLHKWKDKPATEQAAAHRRNLEILMIGDPALIDDDMVTVQAWNAEHSRGISRAFSRTETLRETLARTHTPVDGIWGDLDATAINLLDERAEILRALDPKSTLQRIAGGGHWIQYEKPEVFNPMLAQLLGARR